MAVDDGITSLWAVVVPTAATDTNLVTCPSFETNTTGWTATSATLTRTAGAGVFGAYGGRLLASAQNGNAAFTCASVASGSSNAASAWVKATSALVKLRCVIGATTVDQAHPGDGLWHRLSVSVTAPSATTPVVSVRDERASAWANVDVDAIQVETGYAAPTTYLDGDQDGCSWTGTPHGSTSTRNGRDGRGGQIIDFATIGLYVTEIGGAGNAPVDVATQQLAYTDGSVYVRSLAKERVMTLTAEMLYPTGLIGALHTVRSAVVSALNLDKRDGRGPIVLRYGGASTPKRLTAYYEGGLEMDKVEPTTEVAPLRFLCPDPYYYAETEAQASLTANAATTGVNGFALRSAGGIWSNVGGGSSSGGSVPITAAIRMNDGSILVGGSFTSIGGVAGNDYLVAWNGSSWVKLGGVVPGSPVYTIAGAPSGDVYIAGVFLNMAGIANADRIAKWDGSAWSALSTGANSHIWSMAVDPSTGYLWAVGDFTSIGGTAATNVAYWNGSAWVSAASGITASLPGPLDAIKAGPDGRMYCAGSAGVYVWGGSSWSVLSSTGGTYQINALRTINGRLYAAGFFTTIGGVAANGVASWNGTAWSPLGTGLASPSSTVNIQRIGSLQDGSIVVAGTNWSTIGGITTPDNIAVWNGSTWLPFSADPPNTATHSNDQYTLFTFPDGEVLVSWAAVSGTFGTTLTAEGVTSVTNGGSANAYPILTFTSSGQVFSLKNLTTGQSMYFNGLSIATGETATLDLRPGLKTFTSFARDLRSYIQAGSDLATFCLAPGVNQIALYALGGTTTLRFKARSWSAD